jgi:hypothetical protein
MKTKSSGKDNVADTLETKIWFTHG